MPLTVQTFKAGVLNYDPLMLKKDGVGAILVQSKEENITSCNIVRTHTRAPVAYVK